MAECEEKIDFNIMNACLDDKNLIEKYHKFTIRKLGSQNPNEKFY